MSNNINKDPNQWLPPSQKPDILCTILELWSRHHSSTYALRHLFCTRMYSHTELSDDEIRLLMGHKTDTKIPDPYSPQSLYMMMLLMDHRLIHSGLTPKWKTVFGPESTEIDIVNAGRYQLIVPREITRQSGELLMELEAILPGNPIIIQSNISLPDNIIQWTMATENRGGTIPNRDYYNWTRKRNSKQDQRR